MPVQRAVGDGRNAHHRGPHIPLREAEHGDLGVTAATGNGRVLFGARPAQVREHEGARRSDERLAGPGEPVTEGLHDGELRGDRAGDVPGPHLVVLEREVDDAVGVRGRLRQPVEIVEVTPVCRGAERGHGRRGLLGSCQAGDVVPGGDELGNDG
jgi:hypothetical protein